MPKRKFENSLDDNMTKKRRVADLINSLSIPIIFYQNISAEVDAKVKNFDERISSINQIRLTRHNSKKIQSAFCVIFRSLLEFMEERLNNNKNISREERWTNSAKVFQVILKASHTPLGRFLQENHPRFREVVEDKFRYAATRTNNQRLENIPEIKDLRYFAEKMKERTFV